MGSYETALAGIGVRVPDILIPNRGIDLSRWAVVACDQFTSQREYWQRAEEYVGEAPSSLRLIFPEAFLGDPEPDERISAINRAMTDYLARGIFDTHPHTLFLVHRVTEAGVGRWGVMVALDLDQYSWEPDSTTMIRATEGTILDRIPPRKEVRKDAPLELPHILVLISDEDRTVIEPLAARTSALRQVYDTDLMLGGGHVTAWAVDAETDLDGFAEALTALHARLDPANPLLFAMGDGNHSFATAKSCWEDIKPTLPEAERALHPARYCLVELENIFDPGLVFEPIHRVLFATPKAVFEGELARHCSGFEVTPVSDLTSLMTAVEGDVAGQRFGYGDAAGLAVYTLTDPDASIAAGTLQHVIDALLDRGETEVDYIHGAEVTRSLAVEDGNIGLFLGGIAKSTFFDTIVTDGALPRKTFSMGEAEEKRYYLEARRIS